MEQILVPVESNLGIDPKKLKKAIAHLPPKRAVKFGGVRIAAKWLSDFADAIGRISDTILVMPVGEGEVVVMTDDTRNQSTIVNHSTEKFGDVKFDYEDPVELVLRAGVSLPEKAGKRDLAVVKWLLKATPASQKDQAMHPAWCGIHIKDGIAYACDTYNLHATAAPRQLTGVGPWIMPTTKGGVIKAEPLDGPGKADTIQGWPIKEHERLLIKVQTLKAAVYGTNRVRFTIGEEAVGISTKAILNAIGLAGDDEFVVMTVFEQRGEFKGIGFGRPDFAALCMGKNEEAGAPIPWNEAEPVVRTGPVSQRIEIQSDLEEGCTQSRFIIEPDGNPIPAVATFQWRNQ